MEEMLAASGQAGIYYACQHGNVAFGPYSEEDANARVAELRAQGVRGVSRGVTEGRFYDSHYVMGGSDFLQAQWRDAGTIVLADMCAGAYIQGGWQAREFVGSFQNISTSDTEGPFAEFWGRMSGAIDDGEKRPAGEAFDASFPPLFTHSGYGNGLTVLSPAVRELKVSADPLPPSNSHSGQVKFDAQMWSFSAERMVQLDGCGARVTGGEWLDPYTLRFDFETTRSGEMQVIVNSTWASSADDVGIHLDGNTDPKGRDHVGPNFDDWETFVDCVAGPSVTPTPISETVTATPVSEGATETPTETATPTPTATSTVTPTATATPTATMTPTATATPEGSQLGDALMGLPSPGTFNATFTNGSCSNYPASFSAQLTLTFTKPNDLVLEQASPPHSNVGVVDLLSGFAMLVEARIEEYPVTFEVVDGELRFSGSYTFIAGGNCTWTVVGTQN